MNTENLTKIPGLQVIEWKKNDGSVSTRYRVRLQKNGVKENRIFDDLDEAKEFINLFKSKLGREKIFSVTEKEKRDIEFYSNLIASQNLQMLISRYKDDYLTPDPNERFESARIKQNTASFLKTISNTVINKPLITDKLHSFYANTIHPKIKLGSLKAEELSIQVIDDYIKARRKTGVKGITIERELNVFSKFIQHLKRSPQYKDIPNVALEADKHLITAYKKEDSINKTRKKSMTDEELEKFLSIFDKSQNPDLKSIVVLSLMTAMRRSEVVNLKWEHIHFDDNIIYLPMTKSGKPREVVMNNETSSFLKDIQNKKKTTTGKIFSYKNSSSFEGSYRKICERANVKVNFHRMRAESFTRLFNKLPGGSDTMIAMFMGVKNISNFVKTHKPNPATLNTETDIIRSGGHKSTQVTFNHYLLNIMKK